LTRLEGDRNDLRVELPDLVTDLTVDGEVVFAAQPVVPDAGTVRHARVELGSGLAGVRGVGHGTSPGTSGGGSGGLRTMRGCHGRELGPGGGPYGRPLVAICAPGSSADRPPTRL